MIDLNYVQWTARLNHEIKAAENGKDAKPIGRLKTSLRAAESFLTTSEAIPDEDDEWITLLRTVERGLEVVGEKC